jgi:hypothetical protein
MATVADFDPTTPSIARVYDYLLNGSGARTGSRPCTCLLVMAR